MHNNWEDLIPFYVAGTLPKADAARLENHLASCETCRQSLDQWRAIATAVRADAASQLRDLPPLTILPTAAQQTSIRPRSAAPITLIAAVFTVILFGGLLAFMVLRNPPRAAQVVNLPTATATLTPQPDVTPSPKPQIIVIEPSITPTRPTPIPPTPTVPTRVIPTQIVSTRVPPTVALPTSVPPPTEIAVTPQMFSAPQTPGCAIHNAVPGSAVNLYAGAGTDTPILRTLADDDRVIALGRTDTGWYRAQYTLSEATVIGWVQQQRVYTSGDCNTLPLISLSPTPTDTVLPFMPTLTPSPTGAPSHPDG